MLAGACLPGVSWHAGGAAVGRRGRRGVVRGGQPLTDDECKIGDRWGVSESETFCRYPCDDFVSRLGERLARRGVIADL